MGVPFEEAAHWVDTLLLLDYAAPTEQLATRIRRWKEELPGTKLGAGMGMQWPVARELSPLVERSRALAAAELDKLRLYNYGLLTQPRLKWVAAITEAARGARSG